MKQCVDELVKEVPWIEELEKKILNQIITINKDNDYRNIMGGRGNSNYQTRWYWRVDASDYLIFNYENYNKIFQTDSVLLKDLKLYGLLFEPIMGLHRLCEISTSSLPMFFSFNLQYFHYIEKALGFH